MHVRSQSSLALLLLAVACTGGSDGSSLTTPPVLPGQVDLSVEKTVDDATPGEGDELLFTITVTNSALGSDATGVHARDLLPVGLTFVDAAPGQGSYDPPTGRWSIGDLASGASTVLELRASVDPGTVGSAFENRVDDLGADQVDPNAANDVDQVSIAVVATLDLAVSKTVDVASPEEGQTIVYTVLVTHVSGAAASGITVLDLLPLGLEYVSHVLTQGAYDPVTGRWSGFGLAPGASLELAITARVGPGTSGTSLANQAALVELAQQDSTSANDTSTATITVSDATNLALTKSANDPAPNEGDNVTFTIGLVNEGPALVTNVVVTDLLPAGTTYQFHNQDVGVYTPATGVWAISALAAGPTERKLVIEVTVDAGTGGTMLVNTATLTALDQDDTDPGDDSASAVLDVGEVVEIVYDVFGVPHVFAHSDAGALFGAGYATARNRLSQMLWNRLVATGRVAEFFGPGAPGTLDEFLESDRKVRLYGFVRHAQKAASSIDSDLRALLDAYAEGVNAFMASPSATRHPVFVQAGVPLEPWTAADSIAVWNHFGGSFGPSELNEAQRLHQFEDLAEALGSEAQAIAQLVVPAITDDSAAVVKQSDVPGALQQAMADYADLVGMGAVPLAAGESAPKFSQTWAVTPDKTVDLKPLLVADPRITILRPNVLHEIHLRGATFDVRGAGPPGAVALLIGSTDHVAWGATALGLDQADLFRIDTDPGQPGQYRLDGAFRPFEVEETETILVAGGAPVVVTYRETVFGPIVTPLVKDVIDDEEYAVRSMLFIEPERVAAEGYLAMFRAVDVDAFGMALEWLRFPSMNVVFADSGGRIGYWANGAVPARSVASVLSAFGGRAALEGNVSANDWIGIVPHEFMPWVLDPADGVLFSANHMPIGSWYPIRIGLAQDGTGETARSRRLRELLVGAPPLDAADVQEIRNDAVPTGIRDLVRLALHARDELGSAANFGAQTEKALFELESWFDAGAELEAVDRGVLIATHIEEIFRDFAVPLIPIYGGGNSGAQKFFKTRIAELEANGMAALTTDELEYLDLTIGEAMDEVDALFGAPPTWLATFATDFLTLDVPAWTDLNGFQSLDPLDVLQLGPLTRVDPRILGTQPDGVHAQVVRVGASDETQALLPFGQGEPGSAHATDQQGLFEGQMLRPAPTSRAAIEALGPFSVETLVF